MFIGFGYKTRLIHLVANEPSRAGIMANLIFSTKENSHSVTRLAEKGTLHKIRRGIYIDTHDEEEIVRTLNNKWMEVACYIFNKPVAVARTAAELKPADGYLYFTSSNIKKRRTVHIAHLVFDVSPGSTEQGVQQLTLELRTSKPARYLLENLARSRRDSGSKKALGSEWIESQLVNQIQKGGEGSINTLRDEAQEMAPALGLEKEFEVFNRLVSAILSTHPAEGLLQTRLGIATAQKEPFDENRIYRFRELSEYLLKTNLAVNPYEYNKSGWRNLTFIESYFSNYIEGTKFTIEEAEKIGFEKEVNYERHEDSHDLLSHIEISGDLSEMYRVPTEPIEFVDILKVRHRLLLAERPSKRPGEFKVKPNQAGDTLFVAPELVEGTLVQGFEIYQALPKGMLRAIFMHFLVSEVHPFDDGNGRVARIMMNAELVSTDQYKFIIPIVHRDNYLNGQKAATRQGRFRTMVKVLHQMQCYTASVHWDDYDDAKSTLIKNAATKEPDEGITTFNKFIAKLGSDYPSG
ncbi:MAG: hypothetical protein ACI9H8_002131 [Lysobacterales bacterium]